MSQFYAEPECIEDLYREKPKCVKREAAMAEAKKDWYPWWDSTQGWDKSLDEVFSQMAKEKAEKEKEYLESLKTSGTAFWKGSISGSSAGAITYEMLEKATAKIGGKTQFYIQDDPTSKVPEK
jgi:hypothetical protein